MKINEVSERTKISKRAIKFYEEKGLLKIKKDDNGYRNYHEEDIQRLSRISLYRKLDISIQDISYLLSHPHEQIEHLQHIYAEKSCNLDHDQQQLEHLKQIIDQHGNLEIIKQMESMIDYESIASGLLEMVPGGLGEYFMYHFLPYLQTSIENEEQQQAFDEIVSFWDNIQLKVPVMMKFSSFIQKKMGNDMEKMTKNMDHRMMMLLDPSPEDYENTKKMIKRSVKMKNSFYFRYNPFMMAQRKFMKQLQDCGYNDIFILNMKKLSPKYKAYHEALSKMNERICEDLGLYYDSNYNIIMKK